MVEDEEKRKNEAINKALDKRKGGTWSGVFPCATLIRYKHGGVEIAFTRYNCRPFMAPEDLLETDSIRVIAGFELKYDDGACRIWLNPALSYVQIEHKSDGSWRVTELYE